MSDTLLEENRENWGSRAGFVLAAIGSAVGLGNLWGFPYKLYSYGGGAFLIPYIIAMLLIGIPLLIAEFSLGHLTQRATPDAFGRANRRFAFVGWWQIILSFVIITYYAVILAYCVSFLGYSIQGIVSGTGELPWAGKGMAGVKKANDFFFSDYLESNESFALGRLQLHIIGALVITWLAMYLCICRGVKLVSKVVLWTVPLPWLMLLILTIRGMTLDGAMQGLEYYLEPNWSQLTTPATWRWAFGQMFFSMSLAFGVMITYASFLHRKSDLNNNAAIIGLADMGTSFMAGLAVFATLGGMAYVTRMAGAGVPVEAVAKGGPSLAFVAFPYALAQLPHAAWFSLLFFGSLLLLGIDSAFSITECVLASVVDKTGWHRGKTLIGLSLIGFVVGLLFCTQGGLTWLDTFDNFINGTWGITLTALLECFVLGWLFRLRRLRQHANERSDWRLGAWWDWTIRLVIPIVLAALFAWSLFDGLRSPGGYLFEYQADVVDIVVPAPGADQMPDRPNLEVQFVADFSGHAEHTFTLDEKKIAQDPKEARCWFLRDEGGDRPLEPKGLKTADLAGKTLVLRTEKITPRTAYTVQSRWTPRPTQDPKTGLDVPVPQKQQGTWHERSKLTSACHRAGLSTGNFAGLCLMAVAPVLAIVIGALRFKGVHHDPIEIPYADARPRGRGAGAITVLLALAGLAVMVQAMLGMLTADRQLRLGESASMALGLGAGLTLGQGVALATAAALLALLWGGWTVHQCERREARASMAPRLGAGLGVLGLGVAAGGGLALAMMTAHFPVEANVYDNELSGTSYVIMACMLGLMVFGLGWCFYRALKGAGQVGDEQVAEEV